MVRTFGNHDDKLTVLGVQVLQVEGGVGNNHTRALVHPDRLQHHLWGLVVLPLHRSQGDTVRKGKWPRGNDCCLPERNTSSQMTVLLLVPMCELHRSFHISPALWRLLRGRRKPRNKPWGRGCNAQLLRGVTGELWSCTSGRKQIGGRKLLNPLPVHYKGVRKARGSRELHFKSQVSVSERALTAREHGHTWMVMFMLCTSDWLKPSLT